MSNLPAQAGPPAPVPGHPHSEDVFPDVQKDHLPPPAGNAFPNASFEGGEHTDTEKNACCSEATETDTEKKVSCSEATQTGPEAKPETQPSTIIVAPVVKKEQWKQRPTRLVREEAAPPGMGREEESEEAAYSAAGQELQNRTTQPLSMSKLRENQKDFAHQPGEGIAATWLLRCWDNGAHSLELEGREAQQLGSIARDCGIDREIGRGAAASGGGSDRA